MEKVRIVEDEFGLMKQPTTQETEQVKRFTLSNGNGVSIQVSHIYTIDPSMQKYCRCSYRKLTYFVKCLAFPCKKKNSQILSIYTSN